MSRAWRAWRSWFCFLASLTRLVVDFGVGNYGCRQTVTLLAFDPVVVDMDPSPMCEPFLGRRLRGESPRVPEVASVEVIAIFYEFDNGSGLGGLGVHGSAFLRHRRAGWC